jgi:hypothetical protein
MLRLFLQLIFKGFKMQKNTTVEAIFTSQGCVVNQSYRIETTSDGMTVRRVLNGAVNDNMSLHISGSEVAHFGERFNRLLISDANAFSKKVADFTKNCAAVENLLSVITSLPIAGDGVVINVEELK